MKKIVSAVALAAVAAGFATAEVKISASYRTGIDALSHQMGYNTTLLNAQSANRSTSDALSFKGSAEYGGLELEIDPTNNSKDTGTVSLPKYNGWINFGKFMFKSGTWDARAVSRVNTDCGNHEGKWWGEPVKPGLAHKLGTAGNGVDVSQQSNKYQTNMIAYVNKDIGLEVRGAFTDKDDSKAGTTTVYSNSDDDVVFANNLWFAEVGYTIKDVGRVLVSSKFSHRDYTVAAFLEPKLADLKALTSLLGFTFEMDNTGATEEYAMAVDARARYAINDQLSVTGMFNWTAGDEISSGENKDAKYASWGMVNVTYKMNDTIQPFCSVIYSAGTTCGGVSKVDFDTQYKASLRIYPGVSIFQTKNANIISGVALDISDVLHTSDYDTHGKLNNMTVTIPVLMRVKF